MAYSPIGQHKSELDTPALLIDMDTLEKNITTITARCKGAGVDWRPHTKGHKSPVIAQKCIDAGAMGVTCAKLGEAEVMAAAGVRDILIANQVVGAQKVSRLVNLRHMSDVMVAVDDPAHIDAIGEAAGSIGVSVRVMVEVNVGMNRSGVDPGAPVAELARYAADADGVDLGGIMGYEGHAMGMPDDKKEAECKRCMGLLAESVAAVKAAGLDVPIVSAGGTGTLAYTPDLDGVTEIQAGGGVMMDTYYAKKLGAKGLNYALTVLASVVSHREPERAVIDAGRKTVHGDYVLPEVLDDDIEVVQLNAEHGHLRLGKNARDLKVGDKIEMVSGYSDMTVFLHDVIYGIRDDRVEAVLDVAARGRLA
ncbi:TPA: alanine racemase [Candidatus Latescibacteria bacterium]|nr:alanine racemase [Candidatus Latescibacterota bacterium]